MGCCVSLPREEEHDNNTQLSAVAVVNHERQLQNVKPEITIHDNIPHATSDTEEEIEKQLELPSTNTNETTWPILVRLSSNGQDITIQVPIEPPYLTIAELRKELLPHVTNKHSRIKLIYLGRILPDQHVIVPTEIDDDVPLPPPKNKTIQIQKQGVIQAMVINK